MLGNPELERALLEQTYDGVMTVTGTSKQEVGGETVVTPDTVLHENIPCALSFSGTPDSKTDANSGQISYQATIYCAPDLAVPAGCRIVVQQYGATCWVCCSTRISATPFPRWMRSLTTL